MLKILVSNIVLLGVVVEYLVHHHVTLGVQLNVVVLVIVLVIAVVVHLKHGTGKLMVVVVGERKKNRGIIPSVYQFLLNNQILFFLYHYRHLVFRIYPADI